MSAASSLNSDIPALHVKSNCTLRQLRLVSGHQDGDPVRAAAAIVQAVESPNPPHRLLLGNDAYDGAVAKLDELHEEFAAWESVSRGADFPDATPAVMA